MWRREVGLAYWLKNKHNAVVLSHKKKGKEKLWERIRIRSLRASVQDCFLKIHPRTTSIEDMFRFSVDINSGLDTFEVVVNQPAPESPECIETETLIQKVCLIEETQVRPLSLPNEDKVCVQQALLTVFPCCRQFMVGVGPAPVHIPPSVQMRLPRTGGNGTLIQGKPTVMSLMSQAFDLPIRQTSVDIELLPDSEKRAFLEEAEHKRGYPADECELIAFFRHVPVEMISKLHFLDNEKAIIYSISKGLNRSRTRIYDVMVIRDSSREVHLIPHGTRNRMVVLN